MRSKFALVLALNSGVGPGLGHPLVAEEIDGHAARLEQAGRSIDDRLEDLLLIAHRADAGGDLAQRPLGVGGLGEVGLGARQLVDEAGVRDGDGGLAGERSDEADIGLVEGVALLRVDLDDAERTRVARDRRGDHRVEPGPLIERGRFG